VINTGTTIITFLMVFLIQNTQNRDARAMHLKLDELIRATKRARNRFMDLETLSNAELDALEQEFRLHHLKKRPSEDLKKHAIAAAPLQSGETRRAG
jgi:low affinity Fe/Cu permease